MGKVVSLQEHKDEYSPHLAGEALCLSCSHKWVAVAPKGTEWLECPECGFTKGHFVFQCEREESHWTCNCGNTLFYITPITIYCPNCGLDAYPFEEGGR